MALRENNKGNAREFGFTGGDGGSSDTKRKGKEESKRNVCVGVVCVWVCGVCCVLCVCVCVIEVHSHTSRTQKIAREDLGESVSNWFSDVCSSCGFKDNDDDDDDDDEFEEAGFEPSSSKNAEKDSSTGTSCFKNSLESASLRDTAVSEIMIELILKMSHPVLVKSSPSSIPGFKISIKAKESETMDTSVYNDDDDDDEEAGFEPSSSDGAEMDLATGTSCFKNRQERASLKDDDGSVSRNEPSSCAENNSSSSSPGSKMSTNSKSTEIKNELILKMSHPVLVKTSPSSIPGSKISIKGQSVRDNDDDDEEAGIEPSSSNCRNGLSYKHILFQKQTRKGKLKDKAGNEGDGDEEACSEPLSSNALLEKRTHLHAHLVTSTEKKGHVRGNEGGGDEEACSEPVSSNALLEKDTSSRTSGVKYREERASVRTMDTSVCNEGGGDEEACSEPLSSNALLEKDTSSRTSGYKYREERASVRGNEGGGDEEACSEPLSSNALLEKDKSSRTSGYKYREERASVRDLESSDTDHDVPVRQPHAKPGPSTTVTMSGHPKRLQKLGEDQSHLLKTLFKTNIALRKELKREDCERIAT
ncbi:hypothetical protein DPMN_059979 [Dreissena polymorpha]|uniref:Uncharacterized protein n=1 Tax=Dreissena polymorpha TaxID=45954 RepID=A0A9D4HH48_DREPO|nr:hypothetical protein DPMN_059979 [Dreissena polymorpha]